MTRRTRRRRNATRAFCAMWLLSAALWPASADDQKLTAILLVARARLPDSDFADSIVLAMNQLGPAPIGIIVNKPTRAAVSDLFSDEKRFSQLHDKVYFGGPVEPMTVWFLFRAATAPKQAVQAFDGVCLSADRNLLLKLLGRDRPMDGLKIFVGHAGWAPGQLETEIARGDWASKHVDADAIFNLKSEHLWPAPEIAPEPTI